MKKLSILFFALIMTFCIGGTIFADGLEKSGDYYYFRRGGEIVKSQFVEDGKSKYYATDNGSLAVNSWIVEDDERYYASNTAALFTNTIETIDGKGYFFDYEGKVRYGWIKGEYYANDEGYLVTGFQQLPLYTSTEIIEDGVEGPSGSTKDKGEVDDIAWFYFNESGTNKYKKFFAEEEEYAVKTINNAKYCFDEAGRLCTGWKKIKDKTPLMSGYMYFVEDETENFAFGQAITNSWFSTYGPSDDEVSGSGDIRYYYFLSTGSPVCAKEDKYIKQRIGEKYYLFNDRGYCEFGIKQVGGEYYYFGNSVTDSSMKTGKFEVDTGDGYKLYYYFDETGKGYSGVYKDKLYYKGLLQCAAEGSKCEAIKVNGVTRLVNSSGQVLKNRKNFKDADGVKWSTNSSGVVTYTDEGSSRDAEPPEETNE